MLSNERRNDMLVGAMEGGSFWYHIPEAACAIIDKYKQPNDCYVDTVLRAVEAGEVIEIHDAEDEDTKVGELSLKGMEKGEELMKYKATEHWQNLVGESDDAETADVWFQFVTMGEIVYS